MTNFSNYFDVYEQAKKEDNPLKDSFVVLVKKVMGKGDGKAMLDMLKKGYLDAPVSPIGSPEGYAYFREGQNNMIRLLDQIVKGEFK